MSASSTPDAIIAGGGIGGAVLAHLLTRRGWRVVVVERHEGPPGLLRPEVLWPWTVERLATILPAARAGDWALPLQGLRLEQGHRVIARVARGTFDSSGIQPVSTDPSQTRRLLLENAPFEVRYGVEVTGVVTEPRERPGLRCRLRADGREVEWHARWIVGDDGSRSRVRAALGIELDLRDFPFDLLVAGFAWPSGDRRDEARVRLKPPEVRARLPLVGLVPLPGGRGIAVLPVRPAVGADGVGEAFEGWIARDSVAARCLRGVGPESLARVGPRWGHAARYGVGRIALLGDALHPVSPAGGQGANMAVADAVALADALVGGDEDAAIALYEARRRPANTRSFRFTRRAVLAGRLPSWCLESLLPAAAGLLSFFPGLIPSALRSASTAFVDEWGADGRRA